LNAIASVEGFTLQLFVEALSALFENEGGYVTDPKIMRRMSSFFLGNERDLGFYVITSHDSDVKFSIDNQISIGILDFGYVHWFIRHIAKRTRLMILDELGPSTGSGW